MPDMNKGVLGRLVDVNSLKLDSSIYLLYFPEVETAIYSSIVIVYILET